MAATSRHIGDIGLWIEKVIDSCETPQQESSARRLVQIFEKRLIEEGSDFYSYYSRKLRDRLDDKFYTRLHTTQANADLN